MCAGCWLDEPDSHVVMNDRVRAVAATTEALYRRHGAGGALHIVVDDFNTEDSSVEFCGSTENVRQGVMDDLETACFEALTAASEPERQSGLAAYEKWHTAADGESVEARHLQEWREEVRAGA